MALSAVLLTACGQTTTDDSSSTDSSTTEVAEDTDSGVIADLPEGCPEKNTLEVSSKEAGTVKFDMNHAWYLSWGPDWGTFYFPSYDDFDPSNYSAHKLEAGESMVGWDLRSADESSIVAGVWNYRKEGENNKLDWINISTPGLAGGIFDDNGKVEITYFGDDYVCGSVTSDDGSSSLNGEFAAKFYLWQ